MSWDTWSSISKPVCKTFEQLGRYEKVLNLVMDLTQLELVNYSGCLVPCTYKEFNIVGEPLRNGFLSHNKINILMANRDKLEKNEELVYPFLSFVAEFGGSLGLLLGLSSMMIFTKGNLNRIC